MATVKSSRLARERVCARLKGDRVVFEELVKDYQDSSQRLTGKRYARFEVLGDLVKAGWRKRAYGNDDDTVMDLLAALDVLFRLAQRIRSR